MSDCCLTPSEQVFCYIKARTSFLLYQGENKLHFDELIIDALRFVLDKHAEL
jgi:hypothetical protein